MSIHALSRIYAMSLTPCEFMLLAQIAERSHTTDDGWLVPNWESIKNSTGFTTAQIDRMLTSLIVDRMVFTSGLVLMPPLSEVNRRLLLAIGEMPAEVQKVSPASDKSPAPKTGYIYLLHGIGTTWYKIGQSICPATRSKQLGTQAPFDVELIYYCEVHHMNAAEQALHNRYASKRTNGEWFELDEGDVSEICAMTSLDFVELEE